MIRFFLFHITQIYVSIQENISLTPKIIRENRFPTFKKENENERNCFVFHHPVWRSIWTMIDLNGQSKKDLVEITKCVELSITFFLKKPTRLTFSYIFNLMASLQSNRNWKRNTRLSILFIIIKKITKLIRKHQNNVKRLESIINKSFLFEILILIYLFNYVKKS